MTALLTTFLALSLPGWAAAALLLFNAFLALKLAATARRIARHERLFAELDHWAADVDDCLDRLALRQAPLSRPKPRPALRTPDPARVAEVAETLGRIEDSGLKDALARLGASLARPKTR